MFRRRHFAVAACALASACSSSACSSSETTSVGSGAGAGGSDPQTSTGGASAGGEAAAPANIAELKVHVLSATLPMLDAASIYTEAQIEQYITDCNGVFEPTEIAWQISELVIQAALDEEIVTESAATGTPKGGVALARNVDLDALMAPNGWDAIVVRQTAALGFGGAYKCSLDAQSGAPGAVFVPLLAGDGSPQVMRKWAHELGHMMDLPHTPCTTEYADNLMMSGSCEHAKLDRVTLTPEQIAAIQAQYAVGGPAACDN